MAKNKIGLELEGFDELIAKLDELNGDIKSTVEDCLKVANDVIEPQVKTAMQKHHRTGETESTIIKTDKIEWEGTTASIDVGFRFPKGLPSVFLMYGTPRMKKDSKLYNAIYGKKTKDEIAKMQALIIADEISKAMGG